MKDDALIRKLRDSGLRPTKQRLALGKLLWGQGCDRHILPETLYQESLSKGSHVSLATVYNTLHQFTDAGLLREIVVDGGRVFYDTNITPHHHFYDEKEGLLSDIPEGDIRVEGLPVPPKNRRIQQVDVIIRVA